MWGGIVDTIGVETNPGNKSDLELHGADPKPENLHKDDGSTFDFSAAPTSSSRLGMKNDVFDTHSVDISAENKSDLMLYDTDSKSKIL